MKVPESVRGKAASKAVMKATYGAVRLVSSTEPQTGRKTVEKMEFSMGVRMVD